LHVVETIADEGDDEETREFIAMLESKAEEQLGSMAESLRSGGVSVRQEIVLGRRGPEILQYSVDHEIDLVVLSSHKVDLAQPAEGLATLSHQVSMLCQCPVLLVK
jgi:nucleotide-binding universal stress UspA family protein